MALEIIDKKLYDVLNGWIYQCPDKIRPLEEIMQYIEKGEELPDKWERWGSEKILNWFRTEPKDIHNKNLSKYFYLSRNNRRIPATDKAMICKDCGNSFIFTAGEQEFYYEQGFENEPTRCPECRRARKERNRNQRFDGTHNDDNRW